MSRKTFAMVGVFATMPMFLFGLNLFDGNKLAQWGLAIAYVIAVVLLVRIANRAAA